MHHKVREKMYIFEQLCSTERKNSKQLCYHCPYWLPLSDVVFLSINSMGRSIITRANSAWHETVPWKDEDRGYPEEVSLRKSTQKASRKVQQILKRGKVTMIQSCLFIFSCISPSKKKSCWCMSFLHCSFMIMFLGFFVVVVQIYYQASV